jgi:aryl-alcohol dehydrogenase-like predicted oxidoreductase
MQYARLGDTGLIVSRMAFGAMTFGTSQGIFATVAKVGGQDAADRMVAKALDSGINFFNTADGYTEGQSEQMLGKALGARRKDAVIATKVGFRSAPELIHQGLSRRHILDSVDGSLRRLNTDFIDVYLFHRLDLNTPLEESLEAMDTLVKQGKVRYAGFSNWPAWVAAKAIGIQTCRGFARFRAAEMYYSLVGRDLEHEIVPFAQDAGVGLTVWSPLAGGFLSGKYTRENPSGDGGRLTGFDILPYDREKGHTVVDKLRALAASHNATPSQVALAWILAKPFITSVILGANKMSHLEDNLGANQVSLSAAEAAELDAMTAPTSIYPNWFTDRVQDVAVKNALGK